MYNPEAFVIFPIEDDDNYFRLRSLKFTLAHRSNGQPNTKKGAVEATHSYPLIHNYFFAKIFSAYGESLIYYDKYITKFSIGFSFSR